MRYRLQRLLNHFDHLNGGDFKLIHIQDDADLRSETVKNGTVLKELATLKAILSKAHREGTLAAEPIGGHILGTVAQHPALGGLALTAKNPGVSARVLPRK